MGIKLHILLLVKAMMTWFNDSRVLVDQRSSSDIMCTNLFCSTELNPQLLPYYKNIPQGFDYSNTKSEVQIVGNI